MNLRKIVSFFPEVKKPEEKKVSFNTKIKWTLVVLIAFFVLSSIPLYGLGENALSNFEYLSIILGANFGSVLSLGIGPIVTASIVLQLLKGSGILNMDTSTPEGKANYHSLQKIMIIFFIIFEAIIYVFMGGLAPSPELSPSAYALMRWFLVGQLFAGGILIMFMDDVINKWGFGSGISLFIAANVSAEMMIRAFSPLTSSGQLAFFSSQAAIGKVWVLISALIGADIGAAKGPFAAILATVIIFLIAVYAQSMKIEIPLSFGRIRGHGMRWPLNFLYTSNIPVILIAALLANMQLWAKLLEGWGKPFLGTFAGGNPATGIVSWIYAPNAGGGGLLGLILDNGFLIGARPYLQAVIYALLLIGGSVLFSIFWVQTAGMDARSQANQILGSGLQIPGFRRDPRVLEVILKRYITPLTVMGGATIGFLAAFADLLGALVHGTGILLTVMIIYRLYEEIARQHMVDMYPALRKMMGK